MTATHKRGDTYDGPQMKFRFPSEEELHNVDYNTVVELTGPKIEPYYKYESSNISHESGSQSRLDGEKLDKVGSLSQVQGNNSCHRVESSGSDSRIDSTNSSAALSEASVTIPSQHNLSFKVTRELSVRSENASLCKKASLRRSKAVRYNVGWLTRLKKLGVDVKSRLRKWRMISLKKALKFNRNKYKLRKTKIKKKSISSPLEKPQSISELKREVADWYSTDFRAAGTSSLVPGKRTFSAKAPSIPESHQKRPPPLPPHRIASTPSLRRAIEEEKLAGQKNQDEWEDDNHNHDDNDNVPSNDVTSLRAYSEGSQASFTDYEDETSSNYQEEQAELMAEYWKLYLVKVITSRIKSKLDFYSSTTFQAPVRACDYEDTLNSSDNDSYGSSSVIDFTPNAGYESLTSMSETDSAYSHSDSESIWTNSTNYYSASATRSPSLLQVQSSAQFGKINFKGIGGDVHRSLTLPYNNWTCIDERLDKTHSRFKSAVVV